MLTLQPEQPLNYLPGQHISVQTPHWPRLWRTYSIANVPRPDGLLRLHVRAVTARSRNGTSCAWSAVPG